MKIKCKCLKVTAVFNSEKLKFGKYNNQIFVKYHTFQWYQNNNVPMVTQTGEHMVEMKQSFLKAVVFFSADVNNWIQMKISFLV